MSLSAKLARWLGHDTTAEIERTQYLSEYTITHSDGTQSTVEAHLFEAEGPLVYFYQYDEEPKSFFYDSIGLSTTRQRILDDIREIEETVIAVDTWTITYDAADGLATRVNNWEYDFHRDWKKGDRP